MPILREVPVAWASVLAPNTQFEPAWELQVTLTKEQAEQLQEEAKAINKKGLKFKEEEGKITFRFRRKVARADGNGENKPPLVCGPGGKDDLWDKLIGNGSICNIQYGLSEYNNKFGKGVTSDLKGVQVIHHVPYGEQDGDGFGEAFNDNPKQSEESSNSYDDEDFS